ncbi:hypothetical protein [Streptomyces sp. JW3]|uniref:hypothetical protein n=1 Tax=Streptomyces sp. JW3 TaxID=3456955 RepID=UPI003FA43981
MAAEETAKRFGAVRLVCETNTQLTDARTLYARHGYRETGRTRATAGRITGSPRISAPDSVIATAGGGGGGLGGR